MGTLDKDTIAIVDYDAGNLGSIVNMFRRIGASAKLVRDPAELEHAEKIILPGVGAFDQCVESLENYGFRDILNQRVLNDGVPVLGVCVGFQMMCETSEEGNCKGLGWIKGHTKDMRKLKTARDNLKFPHIGWNFIDQKNPHPVLDGLPNDPRFYFVHTYHMECERSEDLLATSDYGDLTITASAGRSNIIGTQFHPEKSHKFGIQLFKNFLKWEPSS